MFTDQFVTPVAVNVHSIYPHAHYLCRSMSAWATLPNGERRDLFRIDRWDFDWQDDYTFREPMALPAGTRFAFEYHYDNSLGNPSNPSDPPRRVTLGDRSTDEMGNLTLQVMTKDQATRRQLGEAGVRRDLDKLGYNRALLLELAAILREQNRPDESIKAIASVREREPENAEAMREMGLSYAAMGKLAESEQAFRECLLRDPNQNIARIQLGTLQLRSGRYPQAIEHYRAALVQAPEMAALHSNLATALMANNDLGQAEQHYLQATKLDPTIFQAWFNLGRVLAATGRVEPARAALQRALRLRPAHQHLRQPR